jgi:serine/threonine-protein kinase HipA
MSRPALAVWLYGTHVAGLTEGAGGRLQLTWTDGALDRWGIGSRVMSHLLPVMTGIPAPPRVKAFIDGLLPEGNLRTNWAIDLGADPEDTFALISRYGRDTAGALVFASTEESEPDRSGSYEPLTAAHAGRLLRESARHSPAGTGGMQSTSLAGMHPKIAVHRDGHAWLRCRAGAPSSWILKLGPDPGPAGDVLDTEVLCNDLARRMGLTTARSELVELGATRAIAVERYDRRVTADRSVSRIHQEDLAQALGLNTSDPERKFQRGRELPSLRSAADVLRAGGEGGRDLLRLMAFSHLVGNTDMHAKNISFIRGENGGVSVAPPYDISAHLHHRTTEHVSALSINGKDGMNEITLSDMSAEARGWHLSGLVKRDLELANVAHRLQGALANVDRSAHPGVSDEAFAVLGDRIERAVSEARHIEQPEDRSRGEGAGTGRRTGPRRRS